MHCHGSPTGFLTSALFSIDRQPHPATKYVKLLWGGGDGRGEESRGSWTQGLTLNPIWTQRLIVIQISPTTPVYLLAASQAGAHCSRKHTSPFFLSPLFCGGCHKYWRTGKLEKRLT